jgi:peptide/nickel transport system permease protein
MAQAHAPHEPAEVAAARRQELLRGRPFQVMAAAGNTLRALWDDKAGLLGLVIVAGLAWMAILAPLLAPHDPTAQSLRDRLLPPFWSPGGSFAHPLGTDNLGRDVLSRVIFGSRTSLTVGASVVALAGTAGVLVGLLSGYVGGRLDTVLMRLVDIQVAFPGLLLALLILFMVGPSERTVIAVLALNGWMVYARVTRGTVLSVRETPYVEAAEVIGCGPVRVMLRHVLPNLASPLLTLAVLEFARIVLAEAALSFLGLGIQPPGTSWGLDVATGRDYLYTAWWLVTFPGAAIALTVMGLNLFASWLRVQADPHERARRFATSVLRQRSAT